MKRLTLALLALLAALPLRADDARSVTAGAYTVHYNALPSTVLGADIARHYGLTRSANRGLLNIAVLRQNGDDEQPRAVPARIQATARTLIGQQQSIELRELRDDDAIYYIGQFRIRGEERLRFDLQIVPEGESRAIPVRFEHAFDAR